MDAATEIDRVRPLLGELRQRHPGVLLSVDMVLPTTSTPTRTFRLMAGSCTDNTDAACMRDNGTLVAVMDWASRKVLSWRLSNTLEADFCIEALEEALDRYGAPDIFNTNLWLQH